MMCVLAMQWLAISHIDGNASNSKPCIMANAENIFLILFSIKCQWVVAKFEYKVPKWQK